MINNNTKIMINNLKIWNGNQNINCLTPPPTHPHPLKSLTIVDAETQNMYQ